MQREASSGLLVPQPPFPVHVQVRVVSRWMAFLMRWGVVMGDSSMSVRMSSVLRRHAPGVWRGGRAASPPPVAGGGLGGESAQLG